MRMLYTAEILTIGNELLTGRTVNTNASYIASRLTLMGFSVRRITAIRDELEEIASVIKEILGRSPAIVVVSGGLGPTYDDMTAEGIAKGLDRKLVMNEDALRELREKYQTRGLPLTQERLKMALLPEGAKPIRNEAGIAPGFTLNVNGTDIVATPGVPREMESVLESFLNHMLTRRPPVYYYEESFLVRGVMESTLAPHIKGIVKETGVYIKTHPKGHETSEPYLEVQIAYSGENPDRVKEIVRSVKERVKAVVRELGGTLDRVQNP
ncbi:damage-inducible protein CinA [Metallosphaera sedula]|nr:MULTISPECIES: nicotinamide mononucleotide deamidase-related protein [Metallosphaera]AKV75051.1 damage-inducible protein CinA [Metallosphaera sedula]AKV77290.1 damage-inducible protein CinA [Metallosphaera sedula]AKV79540.1 damage-inducible protein CinA [Metallosphaera sedula]AKV81785.1 damage-inducible protein CinA [Metallosphaera sedula]AKV84018.1 damage-inducible protein CinA [Metallosphaera sedula]